MQKRVAALDLGTNTFHLIIADIEQNRIKKVVLDQQKHVKLGEGGINAGRITEAAYRRGIEALLNFRDQILEYQVETIKAIGTAALRNAANGKEFIDETQTKTGLQIEIIDGEREAMLIYQGVKQAVELKDDSLIMDIGGGSVEFIIANSREILWKKSYPVGAAKLMAEFHSSDPISEEEIRSINLHLNKQLGDLISKIDEFNPHTLIGSAGAFETFAALCQIKTAGTAKDKSQGYKFEGAQLDFILEEILRSTHNERAANAAILSVRTDMIVVASVLTKYIIGKVKPRSVMLSGYALKEGLLVENDVSS